jgi:hypothetical protein
VLTLAAITPYITEGHEPSETQRGRKRMRASRFRCKMCGVAMYQGRALADINLTGIALAEALEAFICRRDPSLENVQLRRATPTGDIESRVQPNKRWYEVIFETEDAVDEDEDIDEDDYKAQQKAKARAKAKAKAEAQARVRTWPPPSRPFMIPDDAGPQS